MFSESRGSDIVAVDATDARGTLLTFRFVSPALDGPRVVTLTLPEWQTVARQIAEAALALGS